MKSPYILVDSRALKVFKGFVIIWVIESYFIHYYVLNKYYWKNIRFGRIIKTLLMPVLGLYLAGKLVMQEFNTIFSEDLEIYKILSTMPY